ncbi:methyltransferase [Bombilactobacillus folatiphilus]|uniref:Methyltransferase n=1 Tax=Bombilactobacillus folatiphilus TaxID=2923362 RepID=A0ABY4P7U2_9LACO|nr:methyltransferase [Bombilactobacillus folatiphilus]UQS81594.1 methyltransferase [Bombilactobacillus folatiphilus]
MTKTLELVPGFDLKLWQDTELYRSSIDSVLLANWIKVKKGQTLADLCSGSGIIGLCLAQKFQVTTYLLELQTSLARLARKSIEDNQLQEKVQLLNINIQDALQYLSHDSLNIISCNPPYFAAKDTPTLGSSRSHNIARHELFFSQELLAQIASKLLKDNGSLYLVYRPDRLIELMQVLQQYNLPVKELLFVYPHVDDVANLVLIKCRKTRRTNGLKIWPALILYNRDGSYSEQLRKFCAR